MGNGNGLGFGMHGTVLSSRPLEMTNSPDRAACSLEVWARPSRCDGLSTILAFSIPENPLQFSLRQSYCDLELQKNSRSETHQAQTESLHLGNIFRVDKRVFLTVTSGRQETSIYVDGALVDKSRQFRFAGNDCTGQLVVGDAPVESATWYGHLLGLAIYHQELTDGQVLRHYETWTARGRPEISASDHNVALYLFDEHAGRIAHNRASLGIDLSIPERYLILHQMLLKPPWKEFELSRPYFEDVAVNIAGFIPFGFFFCAYFSSVRKLERAALVTIILGASVSLTIEILQAYLPTRYSGMTDLVTNTCGTCVGVILCRCQAGRALFTKL